MLQKVILQFLTYVFVVTFLAHNFAGISFAQESLGQTTWFDTSRNPEVAAVKEVSQVNHNAERSERSGFTNQNCIQKEIQLSIKPSRKLNGCWYATSLGMLEKNGHYLLRPGEVTAMRLNSTSSSATKLHPTQNPNIFIEAHPNHATGYGFFVTLRTTETAQTTPTTTPTGTVLAYTTSGKRLKNTNDTLMHVEQKHIWQSENAQWMVIMSDGGSVTRINLTTLTTSKVQLRKKPSGKWIPGSASISNNGRYIAAAIHGAPYSELYITDMAECAKSEHLSTSNDYIDCPIRTLKSTLTSHINNYHSISLPKFIGNHTLSVYHSVDNISYTQYLLQAPNTNPAHNSYLAFGDSFTSGEGAYSYLPTTDIQDENMCHLSRKSYPYLLNEQFNLQSFNSVACSGARIHHILDKPQTNQTITNPAMLFTPGYKAQINYLKDMENKPTIVTVSIGGNDIDFANKLRYCITRHTDCFDSYEDRLEIMQEIDRQQPRLQTMIQKIKAAAPPNVKVYIIGYPSIVSNTSDNCGVNMPLSKKERQLANNIVSHLNHTINEAAKAEGATYIHIEDALQGARLCEAPPTSISMHGITYGNDSGIGNLKFLAKESLHPNVIGQQKIKDAILGQIPNFLHEDTIISRPTVSMTESTLTDAPKTGRPIYKRAQGHVATLNPDHKGITIHADGFDNSLQPNATYTISFNDQQYTTTVQANERGDITTQINVPEAITDNILTLNIQGADDTKELIHIYQYVHLPTPHTDAHATNSDTPTPPRPSLSPLSHTITPHPLHLRALLNTTSTPKFLLNRSAAAQLGEQPIEFSPPQEKVLQMATKSKGAVNHQQLAPSQQKHLISAYSAAILLLTTYVFRKMYKKLRKN